MREFFGLDVDGGGYNRPAEGFMSWQHLVFVTSCVLIMIGFPRFEKLQKKIRGEDLNSLMDELEKDDSPIESPPDVDFDILERLQQMYKK